jgi:hypothetical protein
MSIQSEEVQLEELQTPETDSLINGTNAARLLVAVEDIKQRRNLQVRALIDD